MNTTKTRTAGSLQQLVRRRRMRRNLRKHAVLRPPDHNPKKYVITESEFVTWVRELAGDPKWKHPTPWDEHTFRVGVMHELRHVQSPNARALPRREEGAV